MIKLVTYRVGVSPKLLIQNIVNLLGMQNGRIIVKVQNGKFIHLNIEPSLTPDELEQTEIENKEIK